LIAWRGSSGAGRAIGPDAERSAALGAPLRAITGLWIGVPSALIIVYVFAPAGLCP